MAKPFSSRMSSLGWSAMANSSGRRDPREYIESSHGLHGSAGIDPRLVGALWEWSQSASTHDRDIRGCNPLRATGVELPMSPHATGGGGRTVHPAVLFPG